MRRKGGALQAFIQAGHSGEFKRHTVEDLSSEPVLFDDPSFAYFGSSSDAKDEELYTVDALDQRCSLRNSERVRRALDDWWGVACRCAPSGCNHREGLTEEDYLTVFRCVYKTMVPVWDLAAANKAIRVDWMRDSHGDGFASRREFLDAIFECAPWPDPTQLAPPLLRPPHLVHEHAPDPARTAPSQAGGYVDHEHRGDGVRRLHRVPSLPCD